MMSLDNYKIDEKINDWITFQDSLRNEDREQFKNMIRHVYVYGASINATPEYKQDLAILISLILDQHKTIEWLKKENERLKKKVYMT
jgi:hypothetical protein